MIETEGNATPAPTQWARKLSAFAPLAVALVAFLSFFFMLDASPRGWRERGVPPAGAMHFRDLQTVLAASQCSARGWDVLVANPCDPNGTRMNYPRLWTTLVHGLGLDSFSPRSIGLAMVMAFFLSMALLVRIPSAAALLIWLLVLLSPAVTLAAERGTNDLAIFVLVAVGTWLWAGTRIAQGMGAGLLLGSAVLKLFPVLAFPALFLRRERFAYLLGCACLGLFLVDVLATWKDVVAIHAALPHGIALSYGSEVTIASFLQWTGMATLGTVELTATIRYSALALVGALAGLGLLLGWRVGLGETRSCPETNQLPFVAGTLIFVGTFATGSHWDYRLIFLLLTVPHLLGVARGVYGPGWPRRAGRGALGLVILSLWAGGVFPRAWSHVSGAMACLDLIATPLLFVLLAALTTIAWRRHVAAFR